MPQDNFPIASKPWDRMNLVASLIIAILASLLVASVFIRRFPSNSHGDLTYPDIHSLEHREAFLTKTPWNYSNPSPCGLSPETARQAGCKWSAMTFAWYPAECYDEELDHVFFATEDWAWYSSEDLKEDSRLPRDAIMRGDVRKAYMSMKYHKLHCMFTVRKLYRALLGYALSDNYILTLGHLQHCERFVLREDKPAVKGEFCH